jgi:hypothetical protein
MMVVSPQEVSCIFCLRSLTCLIRLPVVIFTSKQASIKRHNIEPFSSLIMQSSMQ